MKQYKEISKLFPSTLGVGDVVRWIERNRLGQILRRRTGTILFFTPNEAVIRCADNDVAYVELKDLKLKQKLITLSMVLEAWWKLEYKKPKKKPTIQELEAILDNEKDISIGILPNGEIRAYNSNKIIELLKLWKFRKDGKDLSLYDQSEETIKFIYEVLK